VLILDGLDERGLRATSIFIDGAGATARCDSLIGDLTGRVRSQKQSRDAGRAPKEDDMAVASDLAKALDKAYEDKSLTEILDASPAALAGVTDADAEALATAFNIKTVRQLGSNKFFALAAALVVIEKAG
jgi:hypothetical protein